MLTPNVFQETNISEIIIPENVKEIGSGAFRICKNLKKVTINSKTLKISDDAFEYCNNDLVLYGYEGSTTQKFANNKKIKFSKITSANTELNTKQNESVKNTSSEIKILLNEKQLKTDVTPIIENGRTLVPLRAILEDLGAQVTWDAASRTATSKTDKYTLYVTIGSTNVKRKINATNEVKNFTIDTAAKIKDGRTLVPVRFMAELLDKNVQWNSIERNVIITGYINYDELVDTKNTFTYLWMYFLHKKTHYQDDSGMKKIFTLLPGHKPSRVVQPCTQPVQRHIKWWQALSFAQLY